MTDYHARLFEITDDCDSEKDYARGVHEQRRSSRALNMLLQN